MKRSPLNAVSNKRKAENIERRKVMGLAFGDRRDWRCLALEHPAMMAVMGGCYGPVNGHEILPRGRGGSIVDPFNIVLLCNRHNEWASSNPVDATKLGLLRSWNVEDDG